jgi:hypothetical protein
VTFCNFVVARQYSIVKELDDFAAISTRRFFFVMRFAAPADV